MTVKQMTPDDAGRWDAFVAQNDQASFFHRAGWAEVMRRAVGHKSYFLFHVGADGQIDGILPLVHVKSFLFGNALMSSAFCVYGGPVVQNDEALTALDRAAWELAQKLDVEYLEYRSQTRLHSDWPCKDDLYVTFRREIDADPDINMKAIPRKQRAMVRKAIKFDLTADIGRDADLFFALYAESVRNLGTPVFPKRLFSVLLDVFGDDADVLTVRLPDGKPIASVLSFYFKDTVLPYYGGGGVDARTYAGNDFMYWSLMEHAREKGLKCFDFGRSKRDTGSFSFKKNWGFEPEPLHYEYRMKDGADLPDVNPTNPKYRAMIAVWKRLPLGVANLMGPLISRNLG